MQKLFGSQTLKLHVSKHCIALAFHIVYGDFKLNVKFDYDITTFNAQHHVENYTNF